MNSIIKRKDDVRRNKVALPKTVFSARRGRQRRPFFFHMGPVALSITSILLIGLMAVLYLSQVGQAAVANQRLQEIRSEQTTLQRENQDLSQTIAIERSPDYIATQAAKAGLVPEDPKNVNVIQVPGLHPLPEPGK